MIAAFLFLAAAPDGIAGRWEGSSICQVKGSPCHDEHAIYRFRRLGPQQYRIEGYKLVSGRELYMGPIDVTFDAGRSEVAGAVKTGGRTNAELRLHLKGQHLSGTMTQPDGTIYRIIELDKR